MSNEKRKLTLGRVVATCRIDCAIGEPSYAKEVIRAFSRYKDLDWGDLGEEDKQANEDALKKGDDRILAAYDTSRGKIYIITEWDRSYTTIMFADEY